MNKEDKKDLPLGWDWVVITAPFGFAQGASFIVKSQRSKTMVQSPVAERSRSPQIE